MQMVFDQISIELTMDLDRWKRVAHQDWVKCPIVCRHFSVIATTRELSLARNSFDKASAPASGRIPFYITIFSLRFFLIFLQTGNQCTPGGGGVYIVNSSLVSPENDATGNRRASALKYFSSTKVPKYLFTLRFFASFLPHIFADRRCFQ